MRITVKSTENLRIITTCDDDGDVHLSIYGPEYTMSQMGLGSPFVVDADTDLVLGYPAADIAFDKIRGVLGTHEAITVVRALCDPWYKKTKPEVGSMVHELGGHEDPLALHVLEVRVDGTIWVEDPSLPEGHPRRQRAEKYWAECIN